MKLGLSDIVVEDFSLMGMWDHFYNNSTFDHNISNPYVNVTHYEDFKSKSQIIVDDQHYAFKWLNLSGESNDEKHHP